MQSVLPVCSQYCLLSCCRLNRIFIRGVHGKFKWKISNCSCFPCDSPADVTKVPPAATVCSDRTAALIAKLKIWVILVNSPRKLEILLLKMQLAAHHPFLLGSCPRKKPVFSPTSVILNAIIIHRKFDFNSNTKCLADPSSGAAGRFRKRKKKRIAQEKPTASASSRVSRPK